jgi:capsular polysaccharide export protein
VTDIPGKKYNSALCLSDGIVSVPNLAIFTGANKHRSTHGLNFPWQIGNADLIVDWGNKRQEFCQKLGNKQHIDILRLEDGFIRSLGLGVEGSRSFSIVSDWSGIYYDARKTSDLEKILNGEHVLSNQLAELSQRAQSCIDLIQKHQLSKYNHASNFDLGIGKSRRILLVDQTANDLSISGGLASKQSFEQMLQDALAENDSEIIIKTHPDVLSGKKQGYLVDHDLPKNVRLIAEDCNPVNLIAQVDEVWCVTSQMGFEACMARKKVRCYGMPFYAGWGITEDQIKQERRVEKRSLEEIFAAAYLLYSTYFDPDTGGICELEVVIEHIARQRHYWQQNQGDFICLGFDTWKHTYVRDYLRSDDNRILFRQRLSNEDVKNQPRILVWGNNADRASIELANRHGLAVATMEDGFIRSVNLGKYGTAPRSLVIDQQGIYFDPESNSDLEKILSSDSFSENELQQAKSLVEAIVEGGLSKYNVGEIDPVKVSNQPHQKLILVPGQVGIDASIARGCDYINTNMALLAEVRRLNPDAYILFKPHPDIVSGNISESGDYADYADQIEPYTHIHACLSIADEVHTMTSLVGFEALLRHIPTTTYGRPFYAGWGLTTDLTKKGMPKRERQLSLEQLVAGVYVKYPRYINPHTGEFTSAFRSLQALQKELSETGITRISSSLTRRWYLKVRYGGWGMLKTLLSNKQ